MRLYRHVWNCVTSVEIEGSHETRDQRSDEGIRDHSEHLIASSSVSEGLHAVEELGVTVGPLSLLLGDLLLMDYFGSLTRVKANGEFIE